MIKKEILLVGDVSYKILSSLNNISTKYNARKSNIGESGHVVDILEGYPPDIIVIFINNSDSGWLIRIKNAFDKLNYRMIPIVCVGTKSECSLIRKMFMGYVVQDFLLPLSILKLSNLIKQILSAEMPTKYDDESELIPYSSEQKHILVVDDDVKMLRVISAYLNDRYKVSVVKSGAAAIAFLGKKKPDLILLDYLMPICDGAQVLEMIRDLKDMQDIPVIFLTGVSDKESVKQCLRLNPQGYLLKPVAKDQLIKRLEEVFLTR